MRHIESGGKPSRTDSLQNDFSARYRRRFFGQVDGTSSQWEVGERSEATPKQVYEKMHTPPESQSDIECQRIADETGLSAAVAEHLFFTPQGAFLESKYQQFSAQVLRVPEYLAADYPGFFGDNDYDYDDVVAVIETDCVNAQGSILLPQLAAKLNPRFQAHMEQLDAPRTFSSARRDKRAGRYSRHKHWR